MIPKQLVAAECDDQFLSLMMLRSFLLTCYDGNCYVAATISLDSAQNLASKHYFEKH